jgi:hypothetical protein
MEVKAWLSKGKVKVCSGSLKENSYEKFTAQLMNMVCGDQGITMN